MNLAEVLQALNGLPPEQKRAVEEQVQRAVKDKPFIPLPGPQTDAYLSDADVLLYGGQAGGGKTFLSVGLASQEHQSSIIFRRESSQTDGLEKAGKRLIGDRARYNGVDLEWSWADGKSLKLAGMKEPGDWNKHAGRERDFIGFDEAGEFLLEQVSSMLAWNRGPAGQRCRIVLASNPPRSTDGIWLIEWFAPWLDSKFENPARPGELRWAAMLDGKPHWCDGPDPIFVEGESYKPLSFTFIPAALKDNPYRDTPGYRAKLQSLPEPLRSQLLKGDFGSGREDHEWQLIPTAWVEAAQARWKPGAPPGVPMCSIGVDVAQGGTDYTVLAPRYDFWFAALDKVPGAKTPTGSEVAGLVIAKRRDNARIVVDVGGGFGADAFGRLKENQIPATPYLGIKTETHERTKDRQFGFTNVRSASYWALRDALDPDQDGGSPICLPPSKTLLADLTAPRYGQTPRGIQVEPKESVIKRLGRSTDEGDAVVMAWSDGPRELRLNQMRGNWQRPNVVLGHKAARRR